MKYQSNLKEVVKEISTREEVALEAVGQFALGRVKTLTAVDTDNLRPSNDYYINGKTLTIGNTAEYSSYVEQGTRKMKAQPYLKPGVLNNIKQIEQILNRYMKG